MTEWWSYRPSDFLMFSPRVYFRQIESYNVGLFPLQIVMVIVGVGLIGLVLRGRQNDRRLVAIVLAALWLFVGWAYLWSRLSNINWAAVHATFGFVGQAMLTVGLCVRATNQERSVRQKIPGLIVAAIAILFYPALSLLGGNGAGSAEVFGVMPNPTVVATIGLLAANSQRYDFVLFVVPSLWCVASSVTLYTMHDPVWFVPLALCVFGLAAAFLRRGKVDRQTTK
jgi:hypothetical protein